MGKEKSDPSGLFYAGKVLNDHAWDFAYAR